MPFDNPLTVTPTDILDDMLARIPTPDRWCQGLLRLPGPQERFCIMGALYAADHNVLNQGDYFCPVKFDTDAARQVFDALLRRVGNSSRYKSAIDICSFNNTKSHAQVIALLTDARSEFLTLAEKTA